MRESVFIYRDYRRFLKDYYLSRKTADCRFSYPLLAKQCDLKSPTLLLMVIQGKRNLTVENIHRVANGLGLEGKEREGFEALVLENQASTPSERKYYQRKRTDLRDSHGAPVRLRRPDSLLEQWYYPAVLVAVADQRESETLYADIGQRIGVPEKEARQAVQFLLKLGKLGMEDGYFRIDERVSYYSQGNRPHLAQRKFLESQIGLSLRKLRQGFPWSGKFQGFTFTLPPEELETLHAELREWICKKMAELDQRQGSSEVAQLSVQLFPLRALSGPVL